MRLAGHDLDGGHVHRVQPRGAETMQLLARHGASIAGIDHRTARDVSALLTNRLGAAENDIVQKRGVELTAIAQARQHLGCEFNGRDLVQCPIRMALAARGPHMIVDECFCHIGLQNSGRLAACRLPERVLPRLSATKLGARGKA